MLWLFDLDDTLHHATPYMFAHIDTRMTAFIAQELGLSTSAADALRLQYWQQFGSTQAGLRKQHGIDPARFLHFSHDFTINRQLLKYDRRVSHLLRRLPGRRVVFSNGPASYVRRVLTSMNIRSAFDQIIAVDDVHYYGKPEPQAYRRMLKKIGSKAKGCLFIEDSMSNIIAAQKLGIRCVYIGSQRINLRSTPIRLRHTAQLLRFYRQLTMAR